MKFAIIVIMAMVGAAMADCDSKKTRDAFDAFRRKYRKVYKDLEEETYRCKVFGEALERIESHNARQARGEETYIRGINEYSDLTPEEFMREHTGFRPELEDTSREYQSYRTVRKADPSRAAPASADWEATGYVTPVRNQGKCGSCYSFATIAVIESRYLIKYGKARDHIDYAEQHIVDCSGAYGNQMCMGGLMTNSYKFLIKENHGSLPETYYPYTSSNGENGTRCLYKNEYANIRITGYVEVKSGDEEALRQAISEGPVAVGIDADGMQDYVSGIYCPKTLGLPKCSRLLLNHAVLATGYDTKAGYWRIKNSWGEGWGENGYIRMCSTISNMCGIARMASYANIA